ncbi:MAG: ADP-ribosylglycohydrolase family protein [Nitrospirota bacterium]
MDKIERFKGSILGLALGDSAGAPFEGSCHALRDDFEKYLPGVLRYTDDTEMAIGVAESLAASGGLKPDDMAARFAGNYNPFRGYGPATAAILNMIQSGVRWSEANTRVFREGSFGNGAAMRAAPLGLFYHDDRESLREAVEVASSITHSHPLGKEGAVILAYAVSIIIESNGEFKKNRFLDRIIEFTVSNEYAEKLDSVKDLLTRDSFEDVIKMLGNSVLALESVPTSVYAFLKYGEDFKKTIGFCISLGGDTDTIGAMAGALSGCLIGALSLPEEWLLRLEDTEKGRRYISRISERLYEVYKSLKEG